MSDTPIDPQATIGHVHLKVSDVAHAERFYREVLGFRVTARYGSDAVFLSAGDNHHDLALNAWQSRGGAPPPPSATGLFHVAIRYPDRRSLAAAVRRVLDAGVQLDGASDHLVSEAVYLRDPDGNGLELYADRDPESWPRDADGSIEMPTLPLDLGDLLAELG